MEIELNNKVNKTLTEFNYFLQNCLRTSRLLSVKSKDRRLYSQAKIIRDNARQHSTCRTVKDWNALPNEIVNIKSAHRFEKVLFEYLSQWWIFYSKLMINAVELLSILSLVENCLTSLLLSLFHFIDLWFSQWRHQMVKSK